MSGVVIKSRNKYGMFLYFTQREVALGSKIITYAPLVSFRSQVVTYLISLTQNLVAKEVSW